MNGEDFSRLLSEGDEACWADFVAEEQPRWSRQAERWLGGRSDQACDVVQEALIRVFQAIVSRQQAVPEPARYVAGFVRKVAQEHRRQAAGDALAESRVFDKSTTSARVVRADAEKQARRSLRFVLEAIRADVREEAQRDARRERTAPILHWAWLDLVANGAGQTVEAANWLGLEPPALKRLRDRVLERFLQPLALHPVWDSGLAGAPAVDADSVREFLERGPAFREVWVDDCYGCPAELLRNGSVHEVHRADVGVWTKSHRERVRCPVCRDGGAAGSPMDAAQIVELVRRASRSFSGPGGDRR